MTGKNALYAQSGGVTAVINASACGVIETARKHADKIGKVYAGRNGIIGALTEDLIDTSQESRGGHRARCATRPPAPSARAATSSRAWSRTAPEYERLIEVFKAHDIGYFFYNGGGDSADTCLKVSQLSEATGYPLQAIHVPKTVDNDLPITDNCPGFGSVAKYVATVDARGGIRRRLDGAHLDQGVRARSHGPPRRLDHRGRAGSPPRRTASRRTSCCSRRFRSTRTKFLARVKRLRRQVRLLLRRRLRGPAQQGRQASWRRPALRDAFGHAQLGGVGPADRQPGQATSSGSSTTGRWPTTCSARRATSRPRSTSSRPTRWARRRWKWRSRARTR